MYTVVGEYENNEGKTTSAKVAVMIDYHHNEFDIIPVIMKDVDSELQHIASSSDATFTLECLSEKHHDEFKATLKALEEAYDLAVERVKQMNYQNTLNVK